MKHEFITHPDQLDAWCLRLKKAPAIAFDTEFVAEFTYKPQLCLVQVATHDALAVIDPLEVPDLTPFWKILAEGTREIVVHAGREEVLFCLDAVGAPPNRLVDVQLAAGLIGLEYPASYSTLLNKLLGISLKKHETRTDWRRRPLSDRQLEYALDDVRYLLAIREQIGQRLVELNRGNWLLDEQASWLTALEESQKQERWQRVSGASTTSPVGAAIVRALWRWREEQAEARDQPPRRILRDDLIVELARRQTDDPKHIRALRGMERGDLQKAIPEIARRIKEALALAESELPHSMRRDAGSKFSLVTQFLGAALSSICRAAQVAPALVGTANDVRDLVANRLGQRASRQEEPLVLASGWRGEVVGRVLDDLLGGKISIRIADPLSDHPLIFEPSSGGESEQDGQPIVTPLPRPKRARSTSRGRRRRK